MLKNGLKLVANHQQRRWIFTDRNCCSKSSLNRQGKIFSKLFGQRIKGSKKRWYPTTDTNTANDGLIFKAAQLSKPGGAGKNTTRRSAVLNKLFMEEISSMLATGNGIAEHFLGRGLQLTRVKISPDFACVNVYWLGTGEPLADSKLEEDLQRCSGLLRHELSQLRVMGEVPRIHFVQDRTFANIEHVENLLKNMDFGTEDSQSQDEVTNGAEMQKTDTKNFVKQDFYGENKIETKSTTFDETDEKVPPMRHDVFGLDHQNIMLKILSKMRKTKQAWEAHTERQKSSVEPLQDLESVQQKIMAANDGKSSDDFNKFLAQRRDRKKIPERKKYRPSDEIFFLNKEDDFEAEAVVPKELKAYLNKEDYLHEDNNDDKKS